MLIYTHKYTINTLIELLHYLFGNLFIYSDRFTIAYTHTNTNSIHSLTYYNIYLEINSKLCLVIR